MEKIISLMTRGMLVRIQLNSLKNSNLINILIDFSLDWFYIIRGELIKKTKLSWTGLKRKVSNYFNTRWFVKVINDLCSCIAFYKRF